MQSCQAKCRFLTSEKAFLVETFGRIENFSYFCSKYELLMRKPLLILISACTLALGAQAASPMVMESSMGVAEQVEQERTVTLSLEGNHVLVNGANGMVLEVVSLTGRHVATIKIESPAQRVELNLPKGCYILKVGKVVRKVTLH